MGFGTSCVHSGNVLARFGAFRGKPRKQKRKRRYRAVSAAVQRGELVMAGLVCGVCHRPGHNVASCPEVRRACEARDRKADARDSALSMQLDIPFRCISFIFCKGKWKNQLNNVIQLN